MKTVVGLFDTIARANEAKSALLEDGYGVDQIKVMDGNRESYNDNYADDTTPHESLGERIKHFFSGFGEEDNSGHESYTSGVERGGAILSARVEDEEASDVADRLHAYGAADTDDRYSKQMDYAESTDGRNRDASNQQVIPVVQEELEVGKREVNRGSVRVYSHLVETPVSTDVDLHNERIVVERRPVNRAATDADFRSGSNAVELTAMGEEAVVEKRSRVVEEVMVGKVAENRTEHISDTVRHTEVDVDEQPADKNRY